VTSTTTAPAIDAGTVMGKARKENFPVASRLLPRASRADLLALYGFARLVDDIGDESEGDRLAELDWAETELDRAYAGEASHPVFRALQVTLDSVELPRQDFVDLIEANRRDQVVAAYGTYEELLAYCALSAAPVGRLVLRVLGVADARRVQLSDRVCAGLQLVEHWQDVREDAEHGRVYLPKEDLDRFGVDAADLRGSDATPAFRRLLAFEVARARQLLDAGTFLVRSLQGRPRLAVAGFVAGGAVALDAIERAGFDVLGARPRPRPGRLAVNLARVAAGGRP
jgi:squalene synthase HpnC